MSRKNENKKGANGAGSIRKITTTRNGKEYTYWQGRYTEGYDACTGKQIQRSITGKTQKEVAQKLRQITAEIDAKTYVAPCKLSIPHSADFDGKQGKNDHQKSAIRAGLGSQRELCKR